MQSRRNDYDVTDTVCTADPREVAAVVAGIVRKCHPDEPVEPIDRAMLHVASLYQGEVDGFIGCETPYHDLQHVLDVTLAMARIVDGYERSGSTPRLGGRLCVFGVLCALFHDSGYIRKRGDRRHRHGAEYTRGHVARSVDRLRDFLPAVGMEDLDGAVALLHYTGYEVPVERIRLPGEVYSTLGALLGSADILAQMADRCYLEKCHQRLYPEFVLGGIDCEKRPDGSFDIVFESAEDLIFKTPGFYRNAMKRLDGALGGLHRLVSVHFGGSNPYLESLDSNVRYAEAIARARNAAMLRRVPRPPLAVADEDATPPAA